MTEPVVKISGLTFTYGTATTPALRDIDLTIDRGEFITITGPSGCGKSTLALCLTGFIPHAFVGEQRGTVVVQGLDTKKATPTQLAGIVGLVQQDPEGQLCTLKVVDEVAFGPENLCLAPGEIAARVKWALGAVGAGHLSDRDIYSLSGGEKQRVAIAAVLAMNPALIILDEPTANLDPKGTQEVLTTIGRLQQQYNTTIIVIEHRLEQILPLSQRVVVLEEGAVVVDGSPAVVKEWLSGNGKKQFRPLSPVVEQEPYPPAIHADWEVVAPGQPLLSVANLTAAYDQTPVLENVSFDLCPGEIVALMGDNGSGKTSLLQVLLGILKAEAGEITCAGRDLATLTVTERAGFSGLVFQNPNHQLFEKSVLREIQLPSRFLREGRIDWDRLEYLLARFELAPYREQLPFALSFGEKKRLNLVSMLGYFPQILLLDEPLVGQDARRRQLLLETIAHHADQGGATLMVCHDPQVVSGACRRVLFLDRGKVVVDSPPTEAFTQLAHWGRWEYLPEGGGGNFATEGD